VKSRVTVTHFRHAGLNNHRSFTMDFLASALAVLRNLGGAECRIVRALR